MPLPPPPKLDSALFDLDLNPLCLTDAAGVVLHANPSCLRLLGGASRAVIGSPWLDGLDPLDRATAAAAWASLSETGPAIDLVTHCRAQNGTRRTVAWRWAALGPHRIGSAQDLTDSTQALRRLRALFESVPIGLTLTTPDGEILECNRAFETLFWGPLPHSQRSPVTDQLAFQAEGRPRPLLEELEWDIQRPDGSPLPPTERACARALREGRPVRDQEVRLTTPLGRAWLTISAFPVDQPDLGVAVTYSDMSSRMVREQAVEHERHRLAQIIEATGVGTWEWLVPTREVRVNARWAEMLGYRLEELEPISLDTWLELTHPEDLVLGREALQAHFLGETEAYACELRMRRQDGRWAWVQDHGRVVSWGDDGEPLWMFGTHQDITERKQLELAWQRDRERLEEAQRLAQLGHWELDLDSLSLWCSEVVYDILGPGLPGPLHPTLQAWLRLTHPDDRAGVRADVQAARLSGRLGLRQRLVRPDGQLVWVQLLAHDRDGATGPRRRWVGTLRDITETEELQARLVALARTDELTGVANRRHFMATVNAELQSLRRGGSGAALLLLDLDHFKQVNDQHGHGAGDKLLQAVAHTLGDGLRCTDLLGRVGGEEFAVLVRHADTPGTSALAEQLRLRLHRLIVEHAGQRLSVTLSIGYTALRAGDKGPEAGFARADRALYRAKACGRDRITGYDDALDGRPE